MMPRLASTTSASPRFSLLPGQIHSPKGTRRDAILAQALVAISVPMHELVRRASHADVVVRRGGVAKAAAIGDLEIRREVEDPPHLAFDRLTAENAQNLQADPEGLCHEP